MTPSEKSRLERNLSIIRKGEGVFLKVGRALADIRDRRLYRERYQTFEAFVDAELGWTRRYGDLLIQEARIAERVNASVSNILPPKNENTCSHSGKNKPPDKPTITKESQVRPLRSVPEKAQPVVWQRAIKNAGGKAPTARQVQQAVNDYQRQQPKPKPKPVARPKPFNNEIEALRYLVRVIPPLLSLIDNKRVNIKDIKDRGGDVGGVRRLYQNMMGRILRGLESGEHVALCPPDISDVVAYARSQTLPETHAENFLDHYEGNGWVAGSNLVTDWRSKYRQWCRRQKEFVREKEDKHEAQRNTDFLTAKAQYLTEEEYYAQNGEHP